MCKFQKILGGALILFSIMSSCISEEHADRNCMSRIIIQFDWSQVQEPSDEELIEVMVTDITNTGITPIELHINRSGAEVDLEVDTYEFVGDETHENVTLERTIMSVNTDESGEYLEPEYFTGGATVQNIDAVSAVQIVVIPMRQQVRPLILRVIFEGEGVNLLASATGTISGITMARDINSGFIPIDRSERPYAISNGSVSYNLTNNGNNVFSDRKNLIGIDGGAEQVLDFNIVYTDGTERNVRLDVTDEMIGFHTQNITEPWVLELVLNMGLGNIGVTIEDWQSGAESELIAR